ncbi:MAG: copper resistance protein B [Deltaproteobacteria bacterium]|nr:copper resistance protein B [Deltaproteobacteria bacterium]
MNGAQRLCSAASLVFLSAVTAQAAGTTLSGAPVGWTEPVLDSKPHAFVLFDQLEYQHTDAPDALRWDVLAWYGGDVNRLWLETEGEHRTGGTGEIERIDVEYGRLIAPFWDLQAGLGYQRRYGAGPARERFWAVVGLQGLAPYGFEVDANLRVSDKGDVSADLELEYELLLTQRLILQPRFETELAVQEVEEFGVGRGFNAVGLGLRLRYELRRELAPYVGASWARTLGGAADLARAEGEDVATFSVVGGVRLWF